MPPASVVPLAEERIPAAATAMARAFLADPLMTHVQPDEAERGRVLPALFAAGLRFGRLVGEAYGAGEGPDGGAFWTPSPGGELTPERIEASGFDAALVVLGDAAAARLLSALEELDGLTQTLVPPPHWYLSAIGVSPERAGQGLGRALTRAFLARAAEDGVPACLWTAQPRNVAFYRGLGFDLLRDGVAHGSGLPYWIFRCDPPAR